jgi:hypothetical protein
VAIGPVQMLVIGFDGEELHGAIAAELDRLRAQDTIRLLDVIVVRKDDGGRITIAEARDGDAGRLARRLIDGSETELLAHLDAADPDDLWNLADTIPVGTAAAMAVIEHRWAIPLRDAIARAGGFPILDAWVAEADLASIGLPVGA